MTEYNMIRYLIADTTLMTLLAATSTDKKIYPCLPPTEPTLPYILYFWQMGANDEILEGDRIQLTIRAATKLTATQIRDRLKVLLDKQDAIQDTIFHTQSPDAYIYYCRLVSGNEFNDPDTRDFNIVLFFDVKYKKS